MNKNEIIALLRMQRLPGVGPMGARKLVAHFGCAEAIFTASKKELKQIEGIGEVFSEKLLNTGFQREAEEQWIQIERAGIRCLTYWHPDFPHLLRHCADAPILLFQKGDFSFTRGRFISIVGTRNMTSYGRDFCERFLEEIAPYGPVVVSGLAYGVDICAHLGALKHGLKTISCLAHGLDRIYPEAHARYASRIKENGSFISEFWLGTQPEPMNFIRRNRIIAGLSEATIVVESAQKGGSLVTADLAFGYHREVFAVPGRVGDYFSRGCNQLIRRQKAQILDSAEEFAGAMNWSEEQGIHKSDLGTQINLENFGTQEKAIVLFLAENGIQFLDDIARMCEVTIQQAASSLLKLELKGFVQPLPAKKFQLRHI